MAKLIVTLAALWILAPAVALAGGGLDDMPQQKTIVIENHVPAPPPADNNGVIIAAIIAGVFTLAGTVVAVRKKS
jgi:hypothetical protein